MSFLSCGCSSRPRIIVGGDGASPGQLGQLVVLNALPFVKLAEISNALRPYIHSAAPSSYSPSSNNRLQRFNMFASYLPGCMVPIASLAPTALGRATTLTDAAISSVGNGQFAILEIFDPWFMFTSYLAHKVHQLTNLVTSTVLAFVSITDMVIEAILGRLSLLELAENLILYGIMFEGTIMKAVDSIEFLARSHVLGLFAQLEKRFVTDTKVAVGLREDSRMVLSILRRYLPSALGLLDESVKGVYLRPRMPFDVVLNMSKLKTSEAAAYELCKQLQRRAASQTLSVLHTYNFPKQPQQHSQRILSVVFCPHCSPQRDGAAPTNPSQQLGGYDGVTNSGGTNVMTGFGVNNIGDFPWLAPILHAPNSGQGQGTTLPPCGLCAEKVLAILRTRPCGSVADSKQ